MAAGMAAAAVLSAPARATPNAPVAPATVADCTAPEWAAVLSPAAPITAAAHWLDGRRIRWPDSAKTGRGEGVGGTPRFRLHAATHGALRAVVGERIGGAQHSLVLSPAADPLPTALAERFAFVAPGVDLALPAAAKVQLQALLRSELVLTEEAADGRILRATALQPAGALDDLYRAAAVVNDLGATTHPRGTNFALWAPTARRASLCLHRPNLTRPSLVPLQRDAVTGVWRHRTPADLRGAEYTYLVDVFVRGAGWVRNRVTDPYSLSLTTDSQRSVVIDLDAKTTQPEGWGRTHAPATVAAATDMVIYELHVRDFSISDASVPVAQRGKYMAFTATESMGMRHLRALARAGLTDVHLLPIFDIASIPEAGCTTPAIGEAAHSGPASEVQQALVAASKSKDCFNWGYDPLHYTAPEGSYASTAADGAVRVRELRAMVQALHTAGLRVGMDVVYNHTPEAGQHRHSVLDRIVPGYYHRYDAAGIVERSTCCANTATEHAMMAKLMSDSVLTWARHYAIDSFRFDLMGHQPLAAMLALQQRLKHETGRDIQLIGEGWNYGEVENGRRFVQASQLSLNGSGIGTFSDRARDAVRGGGAGDSGLDMITRQGYVFGLHYDPNERVQATAVGALAPAGGAAPPSSSATPPASSATELARTADLLRVGLAGSIRRYPLHTHSGETRALEHIAYGNQPAGYVSQPGEVVNYVENHDNQTLFDAGVYKLPVSTSREDRARVQILAAAINAFSQGIAYFHAGIDTLRSKSLDRNSCDSGDWFNRIDWSYQDNHFGSGLPLKDDNGADWPLMRPLLANPAIKPTPAEIAFTRDAFRDLLRIRASTTLLRLRSADDITQRLRFFNTGPQQQATVLAAHIDGQGYPGARFRELVYLINVDKVAHEVSDLALRDKALVLHPVQRAAIAADPRAQQARFDAASGRFSLPPRTAVVFVVE